MVTWIYLLTFVLLGLLGSGRSTKLSFKKVILILCYYDNFKVAISHVLTTVFFFTSHCCFAYNELCDICERNCCPVGYMDVSIDISRTLVDKFETYVFHRLTVVRHHFSP